MGNELPLATENPVQRISLQIHGVLTHPGWRLTVGLFFLYTGLSDLYNHVGEDIHEVGIRAHHGVIFLGLLVVIRSLGELLEKLASSADALEDVTLPFGRRVIERFFALMHTKIALGITAVFLFVAGFTDAVEFVLVADHDATPSAFMLLFFAIAATSYVVLGASESEEHLYSKNQRKLFEEFLPKRLQLLGALMILGVSIWQGIMDTEELQRATTDHATLLWAINESVKNGIRALLQVTRKPDL